MKNQRFCPIHRVPLVRKPILYGLPEPGKDISRYISGGCCVDDNAPAWGYECPACGKSFEADD